MPETTRNPETKPTLDLALIGNCAISALIDSRARIVWSCFPRFDGDPVFHALLGNRDSNPRTGCFEISLEGLTASRQSYVSNSAILQTVLESAEGAVEITDFAPRFKWRDRSFRPQTLVRRVRPLQGSPRISVSVRPCRDSGRAVRPMTMGSNHLRFSGPDDTLRLTTDAPIDYVATSTPFILDQPINLFFGPDETLEGGVAETARDFEERTLDYWQTR